MDPSCLVSAVEAAGVGEMVWGIYSWHTVGPLVQPCILKVRLSSSRWKRFPSPSQKSAWTSTFPARLLQRESTQLPQRSAPEQFTLEEIPITESKVSMDVNFSGSSPAKRVNSKSVSPPPGAVLVLHSLLLEFPLSMAFAEQLLTYSVGETIERSEDELDTVPTSVLIQVVELLVPEEKFLTLEVFHKFTLDRAKQDIRSVWRAILACGYDLHFDRCPSGEFASATRTASARFCVRPKGAAAL
nr:probable E3 ubiquitin-protein ligase HECTD4 isoform X6 [Danio rerio]|eukprot:XP_021324820.1 probable E3 ubiquitin-protein ligase HECTD4 isoform X6 [Danio rerio]